MRSTINMRRSLGFTIIELITVIVILGILGIMAASRFLSARDEAVESNLKGVLGQMKHGVKSYYLEQRIAGTPAYPSALDSSLLGTVPAHPQNTFGVAVVQTATSAGVVDPTNKVLKSGVAGAYWYNTANGIVRARVGDMGTSDSTLAFYNKVNGASATALGNYGGGGGGGGS